MCVSVCVCLSRSRSTNLCVLNLDVGVTVSMSVCSFHAGRCHGDPLFFVSEGECDAPDSGKLEWAKFRAKMASRSSAQEPCGLNTCYEWETCSGEFLDFYWDCYSFLNGYDDKTLEFNLLKTDVHLKEKNIFLYF